MKSLPPTFRHRFASLVPKKPIDGTDSSSPDIARLNVVLSGKNPDESVEHKTFAILCWLFGATFTEVCFMFSEEKTLIVTSQKKLNMFNELYQKMLEEKEDQAGGNISNEEKSKLPYLPPLIGFTKDDPELEQKVSEFLKETGVKRCYTMRKEEHIGDFSSNMENMTIKYFKNLVEEGQGPTIKDEESGQIETIDAPEDFNSFFDLRPLISDLLSRKSETEMQLVKTASVIGCALLQKVLIDRVVTCIDKEIELKNKQLPEAAELEFEKREKLQSWKQRHNFDVDQLELVYASCQSGKEYDLRPTAEPGRSNKLATKGPIILSLGVKYQEYCSSVTRTLLIDPTTAQKDAYACLLKAQEAMMNKLKSSPSNSNGNVTGPESNTNLNQVSYADVYNVAKNSLPEDLQQRFVPSAGFALGIEFRDSLLQISPKNTDKFIKPGTVLCLSLGVISTEKEPWALWITDTAVVMENKNIQNQNTTNGNSGSQSNTCDALILTLGCKRDLASIQYDLLDESEALIQTAKDAVAAGANGLNGTTTNGAAAGSTANGSVTAPGSVTSTGQGQQQGQVQLPPGYVYNAQGVPVPITQAQVGMLPGANKLQPAVPGMHLPQNQIGLRQRSQRTCAAQLNQHMLASVEMMEKQIELRKMKIVELQERFKNGYRETEATANKKKKFDDEAYKSVSEYPRFPPNLALKIFVDTRNNVDCVMLPINRIMVPFSVKVIKNMSLSQDDKEIWTLRVIMYTPGGGGSTFEDYPQMPDEWIEERKEKIQERATLKFNQQKAMRKKQKQRMALTVSNSSSEGGDQNGTNGNNSDEKVKKEDVDSDEDPENAAIAERIADSLKGPTRRIFIKELVYRSSSGQNFNNTVNTFKEVQKAQRAREMEASARQGLIQQQALRTLQAAQPPCMREISIRPLLGSRKAVGRLEAHANGLRFLAQRSEHVDILYSNIQHAIFEPCQSDSVNTLLHFYLKNELIINKKRTRNVQFYMEVLNNSEDLCGRRPLTTGDERGEEQREKQLLNRVNAAFRTFIDHLYKLMTQSGDIDKTFQFEYPIQQLKFIGVPNRSAVTVMPTLKCLVALQEWPTFCIPWKDVELCVFERYSLDLKEFDLIIVLKDYHLNNCQGSVLKISAVSNREWGERIKSILNRWGIVWYTYHQSMKWSELMKEVIKEIRSGEFQRTNGWEAWFSSGDDATGALSKQHDDSSSEDESGSEFKPDSESESGDKDDDEFEASSDEDQSSSSHDSNVSDEDSDGSSVIDLDDVADSSDGNSSESDNRKKNNRSKKNKNATGQKSNRDRGNNIHSGPTGKTKVGQLGSKGNGKNGTSSNKQPIASNPMIVTRPQAVQQNGGNAAPLPKRPREMVVKEGRAFK